MMALGAPAATTLAHDLAATPDAPGAQAAVAALGRLGDPTVSPVLIERLQKRDDTAYEAALALGRLGSGEAAADLERVMMDASRDVTTRTAAAAALLDLGRSARALPMLEAVLLAGTPAGQESTREFRLPTTTRWALEKWLAIDAVQRATGGEYFGLDPDASWPRLERGVAALHAYFAER